MPSMQVRKSLSRARDREMFKDNPSRVLAPITYAENLLPTMDGKLPGIVSMDPPTLQCDRCGAVAVAPPGMSFWAHVMTAGFGLFRGDPRRLCTPCGE